MRTKKPTRRKSKLFVAVICAKVQLPSPLGIIYSGRPSMGDWACFIGDDKEKVITQALKARDKWTASGNYGPYDVFTGELTSKVNELRRYSEVRLA